MRVEDGDGDEAKKKGECNASQEGLLCPGRAQTPLHTGLDASYWLLPHINWLRYVDADKHSLPKNVSQTQTGSASQNIMCT